MYLAIEFQQDQKVNSLGSLKIETHSLTDRLPKWLTKGDIELGTSGTTRW